MIKCPLRACTEKLEAKQAEVRLQQDGATPGTKKAKRQKTGAKLLVCAEQVDTWLGGRADEARRLPWVSI